MSTPRQKLAVKELLENPRSQYKALIKAGYEHNTAIDPTNVTESKGFKEEAKPIVQRLKNAITRAINAQKKCINKASYNDHTNLIGKYQSLVQLLEGKPTENQEIKIVNYANSTEL